MAVDWPDYEFQPSFVLGFHGCSRETGEAILHGITPHLQWSENDYDWLGHGVYFWEGDPSRAMAWAESHRDAGRITEPFVLGAIIDLGLCLDLFRRDGLRQVRDAYSVLYRALRKADIPIPRNVGARPDRSGRRLDCSVLNYLHEYRRRRNEEPYDSIRAPFLEGQRIYTGAGFRSHNHIQICVRNTRCIKGYFRPVANAPTP